MVILSHLDHGGNLPSDFSHKRKMAICRALGHCLRVSVAKELRNPFLRIERCDVALKDTGDQGCYLFLFPGDHRPEYDEVCFTGHFVRSRSRVVSTELSVGPKALTEELVVGHACGTRNLG